MTKDHSHAWWNERCKPGSPVRYYPVLGAEQYKDTFTRSRAWTLGDGTQVVLIEGRSGGIAIGHLTPLEWTDTELDDIRSWRDTMHDLAVSLEDIESNPELCASMWQMGVPIDSRPYRALVDRAKLILAAAEDWRTAHAEDPPEVAKDDSSK